MTKHDFEPLHHEMGHHIASGIFNSGLVQMVRFLCQIGSVIILSRLLSPSDFGIIAMVGPVYGFVSLFQDLGLSQATVQKPNLTHDEVNAFFWINMAVGATLTALVIAISPLVGWYYNEPQVVPLTIAMGLLILVGATANQHSAILTRRMEFKALAVNGAIGAASTLIFSIIGALIVKNFWALYWGMVAGIVLPVMGAWIASRWKPTAPRSVPGLSHMLKFGAGITGANLASFLAGNTDNVLIGHRWGDHALGLYDRAYKLLLFPVQRIVTPVMSTMVPVLSRLNNEPERYRSILLKATTQLTLAIWPGIIWAIVLSETLIPILLGDKWSNAAPIFQPLAFAGLMQAVNSPASCLFVSQGRAGEFARWSFFSTALSIASFVIGLPYGPVGVATAFAVSEFIRTPFLWWYISRRGPVKTRDVFGAVSPQIISGVVTAFALVGYRHLVVATPLLQLVGGLVIAYATMALAMSLLPSGRATLRQSLIAAQKIMWHALRK